MRYAKLIAECGSCSAAVARLGLGQGHIDMVRREMDAAAAKGIHYICDDEPHYPAAMRAVKNHPPVITARGNLETLNRQAVSIVGTRHATAAGMGFVRDMAREFAARGVAVASGMAMGTDTAAHCGALAAGGRAQTIAVLAGGVDYIWPQENESLYRRITECGVVISEMPVGFVPGPTNFVQRNRWVAALGGKLILGGGRFKLWQYDNRSIRGGIWARNLGDSVASGRCQGRRAEFADCGRGGKIMQWDIGFFPNNANSDIKEKKSSPENILLDAIGTIAVSESVLADVVKKSVSEIKRDLVILELQGLVRKIDGGYVRA